MILNNEVRLAMYFAGHYDRGVFSFEDDFFSGDESGKYISFQSYFLIAHELTHLALGKGNAIEESFAENLAIMVCLSALRQEDEKAIRQYGWYFLGKETGDIDEFRHGLMESAHFRHLLEECYCDYMGLKILSGYARMEISMNAVVNMLNCLIVIELVRDALRNGLLKKNFDFNYAETSTSSFFSVLRTELVYLIIRNSGFTNIMRQGHFSDHAKAIDELRGFITALPNAESFATVQDIQLPVGEEQVIDTMVRQLYFSSIG